MFLRKACKRSPSAGWAREMSLLPAQTAETSPCDSAPRAPAGGKKPDKAAFREKGQRRERAGSQVPVRVSVHQTGWASGSEENWRQVLMVRLAASSGQASESN